MKGEGVDAEAIAQSLSLDDLRIILLEGRFGRSPFGAHIMRPLVRRGIFQRVERKGFQTRWELTPLGTAIRNLLEGADNAEG